MIISFYLNYDDLVGMIDATLYMAHHITLKNNL